MGERLKHPVLFPCANRVQIPQVGEDVRPIKVAQSLDEDHPLLKPKRLPVTVSTSLIQNVSSGLSFTEDVVKERCFHMLPYDSKYLKAACDISDLIPRPPKSRAPIGRHNVRGTDQRHMPCHIQRRASPKLKPLKRKVSQKAIKMHQRALTESQESSKSDEPSDSVFLTEGSYEESVALDAGKGKRGWDEYLMSLLSQNTAQWIVKQRLSPSDPKHEQLKQVVEDYHGKVEDAVELVPDTVSESEFPIHEEEPKQTNWKQSGATFLERVRKIQKGKDVGSDPYTSDGTAAFYRLPAGFRRAKKHQDREEAGAINSTAYAIEVKSYEPPPLPTLKDFMNQEVGDKAFLTDNMFEQEWLTGGEQLYQKANDEKDKILMNSQNKYKKVLQKQIPGKPEAWYRTDSAKRRSEENPAAVKQLDKGMHRWRSLPEPIDHYTEMVIMDPETGKPVNQEEEADKDTAEKLNLVAPGVDPEMRKSPDPESRRETRNNNVLTKIVDDWRKKWHLDMRYADATPEDLIQDMADLHPGIRLKAITTCARAAEYRPPPEPGIELDPEKKNINQISLLPENLFTALECCLDDANEQVQRAAAIALFTLERPCPEADVILRKTLKIRGSVDRWAAAQCLAYYGECDSDVVGELVFQLLNSESRIRHEQAAHLLSRLSENSTLVHSMLGEQLNSSSWRHRVMVCRTFPKLYGHINKDLVHKLSHLMWDDWHSEVRKAAAQCLGKTGHGKEVHDELKEKIMSGSERERVEAVSKIGHLGIMTAKILPAFLACFEDSYVSVRTEVCIACSNLFIRDDQVLDHLIKLATYDPVWKIKALAIQALGKIGIVTPQIRESILWSLRYEGEPGVRAEACHSIVKLGFKDAEVVQILQDRFLVESSIVVKNEIIEALKTFGISPTEDMDMIAQIKNEVRKLCTRNNIAAQITVNEAAEDKQNNIDRMIYQSKKEKKEPVRPISVQSTQSSVKSYPRILVTPEGSQFAPHSRDGTRLTPIADEEITAILNRKEALTPYTTSDSATEHSRVRSGITVATDDLSSGSEDEMGDSDSETYVSTGRIHDVDAAGEPVPIGEAVRTNSMVASRAAASGLLSRHGSGRRFSDRLGHMEDADKDDPESAAEAAKMKLKIQERIAAHAKLPPHLQLSAHRDHSTPDIIDILDFSRTSSKDVVILSSTSETNPVPTHGPITVSNQNLDDIINGANVINSAAKVNNVSGESAGDHTVTVSQTEGTVASDASITASSQSELNDEGMQGTASAAAHTDGAADGSQVGGNKGLVSIVIDSVESDNTVDTSPDGDVLSHKETADEGDSARLLTESAAEKPTVPPEITQEDNSCPSKEVSEGSQTADIDGLAPHGHAKHLLPSHGSLRDETLSSLAIIAEEEDDAKEDLHWTSSSEDEDEVEITATDVEANQ